MRVGFVWGLPGAVFFLGSISIHYINCLIFWKKNIAACLSVCLLAPMSIRPDAAFWVEKTLSGLSREEKIGQLFYPMLTKDTLKAEGFGESDLAGFCAEFGIGGGHLFGGTFESVGEWTDKAQAGSRIPLLLSGDIDRGGGNRIRGGAFFPYHMALGAADSEEMAYALGRAIAVEGLAAGFNWAFGPIVDLCASRDYARHIAAIGEDPDQVARLAAAQVRGIQDHGMAACAKHFPGDGHDDRDQHLVTLINPLSEEEWWKQSAPPFQACIEAGVLSIMVAGIALPSIEPACSESRIPVPAVFSEKLIKEIVRGQMGFEGVLVTDALNMGGMACHFPRQERYLRAFLAGNDALLFVRKLRDARAYFLRAMETGVITEERLDHSVRRVLTMKARLGLPAGLKIENQASHHAEFGAEEFRQSARALAESSVTLLRDSKRRMPLHLEPGSNIAHIVITNRESELVTDAFSEVFVRFGHGVTTLVNPDAESVYDRIASGEFQVVVTSLFFPIQWGWGTTRCHGPFIRSMMSGYHLANPQTEFVFISLGGPFPLYEMPFMDPFLVTYGESSCSLGAVAKVLLGIIPARGRVPVGLEGFFQRGDGITTA